MAKVEYKVTSRIEVSGGTLLVWRIQRFHFLKSDTTYQSPQFGDKSKWILEIRSAVNHSTDLRGLVCNLWLVSGVKLNVHYSIGLRDSHGRDRFVREGNFYPAQRYYDTITLYENLKLSDMKEFLPDDTLTVFCELKETGCLKHLSEPVIKVTTNCSEELVTHLGHFLDDKEYSDVTLKSSDQKEFSAHRLILHARSPVFAAMFRNSMVEKTSGVVSIEDIDGETLQSLLAYIYTNEVQVTSYTSAWSLYAAAKKYEMQGLKRRCVNCLAEYLTMDNACDSILLACMYGLENLVQVAIDVIKENAQVVLASKSWAELVLKDVELANEVLQGIFTDQKKPC